MTDVYEAEQIQEVADHIAMLVRAGTTIDAALVRVQRLGPPEALVRQAREEYERRIGAIRELRDPFNLVSDELRKGYWYDGSKPDDIFWPAVRGRLDLDEDALTDVDKASRKIVSLLRPPGAEEIHTRGLVLGYVQSGKTTSFTSVIAKAADVGYRLFIVLSGITDNLRTQTQVRLQDTLVGDQDNLWFMLTDADADFHRRDNAPNVLSRPDQRLLAVIKKNPYRLQRLLRWLDSAGETALRGCPIMIIDDEADQASIDVGTAGRRSRINGLIRQILQKPKAAYVAYTATPFANLLVDPDDYEGVYPRDFIVDLKPGPTYFGPERIFGREPLVPEEEGSPELDGIDVVRSIPDSEIVEVQPPRGRGAVDTWEPSAPPSLILAIRWFVIATAARRARGATDRHSSMLIHTSMLAAAHEKVAAVVQLELQSLRDSFDSDDDGAIDALEAQWQAEQMRLRAEDLGERPVAFGDVLREIREVLAATKLVIDNYRSEDRLAYSRDEPTYVIAVGGNTLSRGLTLEGLICSYFVRAASAYDTLLQMGRWFGYRTGYADLARVWMTTDLAQWFFDLATVEEEVRRDIRKYDLDGEAYTPLQAAARIRTHPAMAITSAAKMRSAVRAQVSYGGTRQQTILFNKQDKTWLDVNLGATRDLLIDVSADAAVGNADNRDGRPMFTGVPAATIIEFLSMYQFHPDALSVRADLLIDYIRRENDQRHLLTWNIVVMEHPNSSNGTADLSLGRRVNLIERTPLDMEGIPHANIKSLVSTIDRVSDVRLSRREIQSEIRGDDVSDAALLEIREQIIGDIGLLCIYPISKSSLPREVPANRTRRRLPMDAADDVIGLGLFFPKSRGTANVTYMSADLSNQIFEDVPDDLSDIDRQDEEAGEEEDRRAEEQRRAAANRGAGAQ